MSNPFVKHPTRLWEIWRMAKEFRCRPSELMGHAIRGDDPHGGGRSVVALVLDRAVWSFGSAVETDMDEAEREFPGIRAAYLACIEKPRTFLELLAAYLRHIGAMQAHRDAAT